LALWCSAGLALAQESKPAPCDLGRNAALTYWRAFALFPEMTNEEDQIVSNRPGTEPKSTLEQRADLSKRWGSALDLMHEAAAIQQCDWGIDYAKEGFGARLPQLSKARALARAAAFRARYYWETGKRKEAADDLRAAIIMARQCGNDGHDTVIAVLVQIGCEATERNSLALMLTDRESADLLANTLGDLLSGSPAPLVGNSILAEKKCCISWFRRLYETDPAAAIAFAAIPVMGTALANKLREMTPQEIVKSLDELDKQYDEFAALDSLPYQEFLAQKPALQEKINASSNPFSKAFLPSLINVREEVEGKYRVPWAMVRCALDFRREGEAALNKVLNPADGKPFLYTDLGGGAFELKSDLKIRDQEVALTFGRAPAQ
jgi:hypothetical protein